MRRLRGVIMCCILLWNGAAVAGAPRVVASIKPVQSLVAGVMDGIAAPEVLIKGGGSLHAYTLRPSEAEALNHADIVFWVGPGFETFLAKPLAALAAKAQAVVLADAPGVTVLLARTGGVWATAEHAHAGGRMDGHLWLSPANSKAMVTAIARVLSARDPANAARYDANAGVVIGKLNALDAELHKKLARVKEKPFVVFHDAYQYFEASYGLNAAGSLTVTPDRAPGARRVAEIKDKVNSLGRTCIFSEPQFEPKLVQTVVGETRAKTGVLDPEGSTLAQGPDMHLTLMRKLADGLVECLSAP
ncbi:MAG: zinc ABC transporter substrate-binding protein [Rhodospirillaceae bacterium]|nr:zinc ABC transporter substrate-binding protein [Rhodospirillaceae bacterium]